MFLEAALPDACGCGDGMKHGHTTADVLPVAILVTREGRRMAGDGSVREIHMVETIGAVVVALTAAAMQLRRESRENLQVQAVIDRLRLVESLPDDLSDRRSALMKAVDWRLGLLAEADAAQHEKDQFSVFLIGSASLFLAYVVWAGSEGISELRALFAVVLTATSLGSFWALLRARWKYREIARLNAATARAQSCLGRVFLAQSRVTAMLQERCYRQTLEESRLQRWWYSKQGHRRLGSCDAAWRRWAKARRIRATGIPRGETDAELATILGGVRDMHEQARRALTSWQRGGNPREIESRFDLLASASVEYADGVGRIVAARRRYGPAS